MMRCDPETTPGPLLPLCPSSRSEPRAHETQELGGVVQQIVTRLLPDGYPGVETVAEMVRVSARTLQRRLSEEGLTFAGLVARARFDVAQRMLDDPARKVVDVALDLGYSDHAHFTRAFVRWTGLSPREFRRVRLAQKSAMSIGGALGGPVTAFQYDWNMLPIGQQLWLDWFQTLKAFPPLQAPESYNLTQVMDQLKAETVKHPGD